MKFEFRYYFAFLFLTDKRECVGHSESERERGRERGHCEPFSCAICHNIIKYNWKFLRNNANSTHFCATISAFFSPHFVHFICYFFPLFSTFTFIFFSKLENLLSWLLSLNFLCFAATVRNFVAFLRLWLLLLLLIPCSVICNRVFRYCKFGLCYLWLLPHLIYVSCGCAWAWLHAPIPWLGFSGCCHALFSVD